MADDTVRIDNSFLVEERKRLALMRVEIDFWEREAGRLQNVLESIPRSIEQHGYVLIRYQDDEIRLVVQEAAADA